MKTLYQLGNKRGARFCSAEDLHVKPNDFTCKEVYSLFCATPPPKTRYSVTRLLKFFKPAR
jgi:hypothetical protein